MGGRPAGRSAIYAEALDRLVASAAQDGRIKGLWLEAPGREDLRRPLRSLEVHLAVDEPDFNAVLSALDCMMAGPAELCVEGRAEVPRFAQEVRGTIDGAPFKAIIEKTPFIGKRPRAAVSMLLDRTGHICHTMDLPLPLPQ